MHFQFLENFRVNLLKRRYQRKQNPNPSLFDSRRRTGRKREHGRFMTQMPRACMHTFDSRDKWVVFKILHYVYKELRSLVHLQLQNAGNTGG